MLRTRSGKATPLALQYHSALVIALATLVGSCSTSAGQAEVTASSPQAAPTRAADEQPTKVANYRHERNCASAIAARPSDTSAPQGLHFLRTEDAANIPLDQLTPDESGRLPIFKVVVEVTGGAPGYLTATIAPEDRGHARFFYSEGRGGPISLDEGAYEAAFEVCDGLLVQYNGGFAVNGARCVHVVVEGTGDALPRLETYAFGQPTCD